MNLCLPGIASKTKGSNHNQPVNLLFFHFEKKEGARSMGDLRGREGPDEIGKQASVRSFLRLIYTRTNNYEREQGSKIEHQDIVHFNVNCDFVSQAEIAASYERMDE